MPEIKPPVYHGTWTGFPPKENAKSNKFTIYIDDLINDTDLEEIVIKLRRK